MTEIVERLMRKTGALGDLHEAANEIEQLRIRAEKAERQVIDAWNAFGPVENDAPLVETIEEAYEMCHIAEGDLAEQIRCLERMLNHG